MIDIRGLLPDESPPTLLLLEADPSRLFAKTGSPNWLTWRSAQAGGVKVWASLVRHAAEHALRTGARILRVGTGNSSLAALALYQKCGFRVTGVERDYFLRHYAEAIVEDGIPCRVRINLELDLREA